MFWLRNKKFNFLLLPDHFLSLKPSPEFIHSKLRSSTINEVPSKGMITSLDKQIFQRTIVIISYPSVFTYVLGAQKNHLIETFLLSTLNICFG